MKQYKEYFYIKVSKTFEKSSNLFDDIYLLDDTISEV